MKDLESVYTPRQVAEYLGVSYQTLAQMRMEGRGPRFLKDGGLVLYTHKDLEDYLEGNRYRHITQYRNKQKDS